MQPNLNVGFGLAIVSVLLVFLSIDTSWAGCNGAPSISDGIQNEMLISKDTLWVVQTQMDAGSVARDVATNSCHGSWGGDQMYQDGCSNPSAIVAMECLKFMAVSGATAMTGVQRNWCCTTERTEEYILSALQSSGGSGGGTSSGASVMIPCPSGTTDQQCIYGFAQGMPINFGVQLGGLVACQSLGFSSSGSCVLSQPAYDIYLTGNCPSNQYSTSHRELGGRTFSLSSAKTQGTLTYYELTSVSNARCFCKPGYYGPFKASTAASASDCSQCPEQDGQIGTPYTVSDMNTYAFNMAVANGTGFTLASCKLLCTTEALCRDSTGYYVGETSGCPYGQ